MVLRSCSCIYEHCWFTPKMSPHGGETNQCNKHTSLHIIFNFNTRLVEKANITVLSSNATKHSLKYIYTRVCPEMSIQILKWAMYVTRKISWNIIHYHIVIKKIKLTKCQSQSDLKLSINSRTKMLIPFVVYYFRLNSLKCPDNVTDRVLLPAQGVTSVINICARPRQIW